MVFKIRDIIIPIVIGIIVSFIVTSSIQLTEIKGDSMKPTLANNKKVLMLSN